MIQKPSATNKTPSPPPAPSRSARNHGFTLIEIIVILAVLAILVATLSPMVLKYIADAQLSRAKSDVTTIQATINDLIRDTGQYPGDKADANFLCGPGAIASMDTAVTGWATALVGAAATSCTLTGNTAPAGSSLAGHLIVNDPNESGTTTSADYKTTGSFRWKGPYAQSLNEDPWGNAYQINSSTLKGSDTNPTWILSAGPDGKFQTSASSTSLASGSDDIGIRIK